MDEESEDELEGMAMEGRRHMHPAAAAGGSSSGGGGGPLGPVEELRAQRFALLRDLWATAG
jgi:hypothetical protein